MNTIQSLLKELETAQRTIAKQREALEACRVFVTPLERRKPGWDQYKQDAADRIRDCVGTP